MTETSKPELTESVTNVIRARRTFKVIGDVENPVKISTEAANKNRPRVLEAIKSAGWAPFHYSRGADGIAEPWRAHVIWHESCRKIAREFYNWFDDVKPGNKLPAMLSACGALVLVNWIPQFRNWDGELDEAATITEPKEKQVQVDEEHLAATAAMIQNLMLILTADGMGTYWSSGGQFRTSAMFDKLGISKNERLLAALFVEFPETRNEPMDRLPGKQRENRSKDSKWLSEIELAP